jgi:hypothetical protein
MLALARALDVTSLDGSTTLTFDELGSLAALTSPAFAPFTFGGGGSMLSFDGSCSFLPAFTSITSLPGGGAFIKRTALCAPLGVAVTVADEVTPEEGAVAWRTSYAVANVSAPTFSVPLGVALSLASPSSPLALWAPWTRGCVDNGHGGMCYSGPDRAWAEPFSPAPLPPSGAPLLLRYGNLDSGVVHAPFGKVTDSFTLPLLSVQRAADDAGFTLLLSPEDPTTELLLRAEVGSLHALRLFHRLAAGAPPVAFTCRFRAHAADFRPALAFWAAAHPAHVEPHVGGMARFEGLGGYSWEAPTNAS